MILSYFQSLRGEKKIKLHKEYESETQKVLLHVESISQNAKHFQHAQLYFVVSGLKIIGHGNPDNNLESYLTIPRYFKI
jgi:hypothetical protein